MHQGLVLQAVALLALTGCAHTVRPTAGAHAATEPAPATEVSEPAPTAPASVGALPTTQRSDEASTTPPEPIQIAPISGDWWMVASGPDSVGNAVVAYVDATGNFYTLIRSPDHLTPPGRDERPTSRIQPDLSMAGAELRREDGVFLHYSMNFRMDDYQCRYVQPCSVQCGPAQGPEGGAVTMLHTIESDGSVRTSVDGRVVTQRQMPARFTPPPTTAAQCQSRVLVLAAMLYEGFDRQNEPR